MRCYKWLYPPGAPGFGILAQVLQPSPVCLRTCGSLSHTAGCSCFFFLVCSFRSMYHTEDPDMASYTNCHKQGPVFNSTCKTPINYKYRAPSSSSANSDWSLVVKAHTAFSLGSQTQHIHGSLNYGHGLSVCLILLRGFRTLLTVSLLFYLPASPAWHLPANRCTHSCLS